ncbi:MAG: hypothetical protein R3C45_16855 [Phycisphaerales bacterium]
MCAMKTIFITAAAGVLSAAPASADPIYELTISGTVSSVSAKPAFQADFDNEFTVGEAFTFVVVYDGGSAVTAAGTNVDVYDTAILSLTGTIGDYAVNAPASGITQLDLRNNSGINSVFGDHFIVRAGIGELTEPLGGPVGGTVPYGLELILSDSTGSLFPGPSGSSPLPLSTAFDFSLIDAIPLTYLLFFEPVSEDDGAGELQFDITGIDLQLAPELVGDLDGDGFVGITDLNIVLGNWNQNVTPADLWLATRRATGSSGSRT